MHGNSSARDLPTKLRVCAPDRFGIYVDQMQLGRLGDVHDLLRVVTPPDANLGTSCALGHVFEHYVAIWHESAIAKMLVFERSGRRPHGAPLIDREVFEAA